METDTDNTRKRKDISSISDLDTSGTAISSPNTEKKQQLKTKKKKKKTAKAAKVEKVEKNQGAGVETLSSSHTSKVEMDSGEIGRQLSEINKKLSNVMTKDDGSLRKIIREVFQQMKEEFLASATNRIEILEGSVFERDQEIDTMNKQVEDLNKTTTDLKNTVSGLQKQVTDKQAEINAQKAANEKLNEQLETLNVNTETKINDIEQYSRKNNVRVSGIPETGNETAEQSIEIVVEKLNNKIADLNLQRDDIDIAHRLGRQKKDKTRQIIVKFSSRLKRDELMRRRRDLKHTGIFVSEDLTPINQLVLACLRKKMPDEVDQAWSKGGKLFYKQKSNPNTITEVQYKDYQTWIDLPWPEPTEESSA